ncbi:hypothetical protein [Bradyrhizobium canariense]|uniref:Uncharacterized protein n=1 Tax=Bradyrhizobium canariense TaxID=255045 RepID=A0A1H1TJN8_9BRAD|nr:hypothetical protein [Bradyrhizobium canariense]SDS60186.1 hypothetical protein SAMN05444158_2568 [Bradyrhizobium canariense]
MTIKASGRSALILATGFWICFAGPSQAASADDADNTAAPVAKHSSHHGKKYAHQSSDKASLKSSDSKKSADSDDSDNSTAVQSSQMPASVANANAQLAADTPVAGSAKAMTERANNIVQAAPDATADIQAAAGTPVVAADQLNDVDRALHEAAPPATPVAMAAADAPVTPATAPVAAASNESSAWDQTSLIGKIFIGFGALLTVASAARMFIA